METDALAIRRRFKDESEQVKQSEDLTPEAKTRKIQDLRNEANTNIGKKRADHSQVNKSLEDAYKENLFVEKEQGEKTNYRNALEIADKTRTEQDLTKAAVRARTLQDQTLLKAIGFVAYERKLFDLARDVLVSEDQKEILDKLINLQTNSTHQRLRISAIFTKI